MPDTETIVKLKVVFQDPFHLKNLYKLIKFWLEDNGYVNADNSTSEKEMEILYSEYVRLGDMKEYHIWWRTEKTPDNKYFKYKMNVDYLGLAIKNTEVVKDDKKYKMQIGEITINITSQLVTEANDKKEKWKKGLFLSNFRNLFRDHWYRKKIEQHEDDLYEETYKLQTAVKEYLELHQYTTPPDLFFKKKGFE